MGTRTLLALVLMTVAALPVVAQVSVGFGPQIGFYDAKGADAMTMMAGAALRLNVSEIFGIEASINYREEGYRSGTVNVKSWPVMVTGLIYPIPIVYGAVGAGWYNSSIDYNVPTGANGVPANVGSETKQEFGWHFGGGLELTMGSAVKLVGDIRYVFLDYNFKTFPGSNGVSNNFAVITAGLLFTL